MAHLQRPAVTLQSKTNKQPALDGVVFMFLWCWMAADAQQVLNVCFHASPCVQWGKPHPAEWLTINMQFKPWKQHQSAKKCVQRRDLWVYLRSDPTRFSLRVNSQAVSPVRGLNQKFRDSLAWILFLSVKLRFLVGNVVLCVMWFYQRKWTHHLWPTLNYQQK